VFVRLAIDLLCASLQHWVVVRHPMLANVPPMVIYAQQPHHSRAVRLIRRAVILDWFALVKHGHKNIITIRVCTSLKHATNN
jgi:hypothetical protein